VSGWLPHARGARTSGMSRRHAADRKRTARCDGGRRLLETCPRGEPAGVPWEVRSPMSSDLRAISGGDTRELVSTKNALFGWRGVGIPTNTWCKASGPTLQSIRTKGALGAPCQKARPPARAGCTLPSSLPPARHAKGQVHALGRASAPPPPPPPRRLVAAGPSLMRKRVAVCRLPQVTSCWYADAHNDPGTHARARPWRAPRSHPLASSRAPPTRHN